MPSPSSSVQQAHQVLGDRLREIRRAADLSARALAMAAGWQESKVSRFEHARRLPTESDLRTWCWICRAEGHLRELLGMRRAVGSMYVDWPRIHGAGMRHGQDSYAAEYERAQRCRVYQSSVIPGPLQTPEYARAIISTVAALRDLPDDIEEVVRARVAHGRFVREGPGTFAVLIEESVLRARLADADAMAGQLGHLLIAMTLPAVSLGVIPLAADRHRWSTESFTITDDELVEVELLSARVQVTQQPELAVYERAFADLSKIAVYGADARRLIAAAIDALE